jgi:ubiquinone/menaquinone biosynthesis C-methylase UbiE
MERRETPFRARVLDVAMRPLDAARPAVVGRAGGRVLEVGAGTGLNLAHFGADTDLVCVEPDAALFSSLRARASEQGRAITVIDASAHALPFADRSFDTVLFSFSLCTIKDPARALREAARVLMAEGSLLVVEHVCAERGVERFLQRALTPLWRTLSSGCHLDRNTRKIVVDAGFTVVEQVRTEVARLPLFPVDAFVARLT